MSTETSRKTYDRRGTVIVWVALSASVLFGFVALAVDVGYLYVVRGQLQHAADAAALAGASALALPTFMTGTAMGEDVAYEARARAVEYAAKNQAAAQPVLISYSNVAVGALGDIEDPMRSAIVPDWPFNVVRVRVSRDEHAPNGPVGLFFATIWGKHTASVSASATAYFDGRMAGFRPRTSGGPAIPISVRWETFRDQIFNGLGEDNFTYDPVTKTITSGADGIPELSIYPEKQKYEESSDGAGNFGILTIDPNNAGGATIADQMLTGMTEEDFTALFGKSMLEFYNDVGDLQRFAVDGELSLSSEYMIGGKPGLMSSLKDELDTRVGSTVGFFIHDYVENSGANAVFVIRAIQFGIMISVDLTGSPESKVIVIQPTTYAGPEIVTDPTAPIHATAGRIKLIR